MKISFTSNLGIQNSMRLSVSQGQTELLKSQQEVTTGTYYDPGVSLGYESGRSVNLTNEQNRMQSIVDSNSIVSQRLDASQSSLSNMSDNVQSSLDALVALSGSSDQTQLSTATQTLQNNLDAFVSAGNTSVNGEYLFAGINTGTKPLSSYDSTSAAKASFDDAFSSYFGFSPTDSAASSITVDGVPGMQDFMENTLEPMYDASSSSDKWKTDWSTASDTNMISQVNTSETVKTSSNANSDGFRNFALASVMGIELLGSNINSDVRSYVSKTAISRLGNTIANVNDEQSSLGLSQSRVESGNTTLKTQIDIVKTSFNNLNEVDAYAASTKVNSLLSQLQASYQLTAKIQSLNLANYI